MSVVDINKCGCIFYLNKSLIKLILETVMCNRDTVKIYHVV